MKYAYTLLLVKIESYIIKQHFISGTAVCQNTGQVYEYIAEVAREKICNDYKGYEISKVIVWRV